MIYKTFDKKKKIPQNYLKKLVDFYYQNGLAQNKKIIRESIKNSLDVLIVQENSKIIGAAKTMGDGVRFVTITDVLVDSEFRGRRVGRKIVVTLAENHAKNNLYSINLNTDPRNPGLVKFYKKCGFVEIKNYKTLKYKKSFIDY